MDKEFQMLADRDFAGLGLVCKKKDIRAGTYVNGKFIVAKNFCAYVAPADPCLREGMPSGMGYELCGSNHAEANLAEMLEVGPFKSDGIAWVLGHYYACEPCAKALKEVGVKEIRVRESL